MSQLFNEYTSNTFSVLAETLNRLNRGEKLRKKDIFSLFDKVRNLEFAAPTTLDLEEKLISILFQFDENGYASSCIGNIEPQLSEQEHQFLKSFLLNEHSQWLIKPSLREKLLALYKDISPLYEETLWQKEPCQNSLSHPQKLLLTTIRQALEEKKYLSLTTRFDKEESLLIIPCRLQYSLATGEFYLLYLTEDLCQVEKLSLEDCATLSLTARNLPENKEKHFLSYLKNNKKKVTFHLYNRNNARERCFSYITNFQKRAKKLKADLFEVELYYYPFEMEGLLYLFLSLGADICIDSPEEIREKLREIWKLTVHYHQEVR